MRIELPSYAERGVGRFTPTPNPSPQGGGERCYPLGGDVVERSRYGGGIERTFAVADERTVSMLRSGPVAIGIPTPSSSPQGGGERCYPLGGGARDRRHAGRGREVSARWFGKGVCAPLAFMAAAGVTPSPPPSPPGGGGRWYPL